MHHQPTFDPSIRCRRYLERAGTPDASAQRPGWAPLLARLWVNDRSGAATWIRALIAECDQHQDCSDFRLNLLLRALRYFPDRIEETLKHDIRRVALEARYYGGFRRDYPMYYSSENHHLNWAVAEYLTGTMWPDTTFPYDRRTGMLHRDRAMFCIARWIDERARWGFWEWNSSCYMGINLLSLLNLYDLADDPAIRRLADDALTLMMADLAADSAHGGIWSAQARLYESQLFDADNQGGATPLNLLMGLGAETGPAPGHIGDFVATTAWRPPEWLVRLARDLEPSMVNRERHRQPGKLHYTCHSIFWKPPRELWQSPWSDTWCPEDYSEVFLQSERCPEYLVSAAFFPDDGQRRHTAQSMLWMSCLNGRIPIFVNQPATDKARFWAGNAVPPRCFLADGVMVALFDSTPESHPDAADFTHAWFPTDAMEETTCLGEWFLGRAGKAYVALRGCGAEPAALMTGGEWAGREIRLPGRTAAWIGVYGNAHRDGDFASFVQRVRAGHVRFEPGTPALDVAFDTTAIHLSTQDPMTVNGNPVSTADRPGIDNPVCRSEWGDPVLHIRQGTNGNERVDLGYAAVMAASAYDRF